MAKNPASKAAGRERGGWTKEKERLLRKLFPTAPWPELLKALPGHSRASLNSKARLMGLSRPNFWHKAKEERMEEKREAAEAKSDEKIAAFMINGKSPTEVARKFGLAEDEVQARMAKGFDGYDLFKGPLNIAGEQTYTAVPRVMNGKIPERVWKWIRSSRPDNPYGAIIIPDDFAHKKIRIIGLDGIFYGDASHDAARFDETVKEIARSPNTFCFLTGDAIGEITGGKKDEREQALLARAVEFDRKLRPIAHKILWAQRGCTEERAVKYQRFDPLQHFCVKYEVPYFTEPCYIDFDWRGHTFRFWVMHGHSTAQVKGAKINALRRPAQIHGFTHFIIMGHVGDAMWNRQVKIIRSPIEARLRAREEFLIILGNFKRYFGTRAARRGDSPPSNDVIKLYLYPDGNHHVKTDPRSTS